ncbi:unconventional myosin-Vc [Platysternon megacephalum]|uniref:Unconventional myosin-Vc n=1 Tax=Platysternon megacephalum TaxID=55544 RepID=A0A4D9E037_9SAUR|nr:unconventional myosin-Vc [Platysternon megacephalum]
MGWAERAPLPPCSDPRAQPHCVEWGGKAAWGSVAQRAEGTEEQQLIPPSAPWAHAALMPRAVDQKEPWESPGGSWAIQTCSRSLREARIIRVFKWLKGKDVVPD